MQQELNESSKNPRNRRVQDTTQFHNHGEDDPAQSLSRQRSAGEGRAQHWSSAGYRTPSEASSSDSGDVADSSVDGLNIPPRKTGSPVDKILEHERASSHSIKKKRGGLAFTVVSRNTKPNPIGGSIVDFPNGKSNQSHQSQWLLMQFRGFDSRPVPSVPCVSFKRLPRLQALPRAGHHTSCLEDSLFALLSRT